MNEIPEDIMFAAEEAVSIGRQNYGMDMVKTVAFFIHTERLRCADQLDEFIDRGYSAYDVRDHFRGKIEINELG